MPVIAEFDYRNEVTVDVLGRIFELSINDIEETKAKSVDQHAQPWPTAAGSREDARNKASTTRPITSSTTWYRPRSIRSGSRPAPTWPGSRMRHFRPGTLRHFRPGTLSGINRRPGNKRFPSLHAPYLPKSRVRGQGHFTE